MTNRITPKQTQAVVADYQKKLDALANGRTAVKESEIADDPVLVRLADAVSTGCGAAPMVSVAKMRETLKTIGATLASADKNNDGEISFVETARLSPLALRMLDLAASKKSDEPEHPKPTPQEPAAPKPTTPEPPHVRTGC